MVGWMERLKGGWKEDGNMEERKEQRKDEWKEGRKQEKIK